MDPKCADRSVKDIPFGMVYFLAPHGTPMEQQFMNERLVELVDILSGFGFTMGSVTTGTFNKLQLHLNHISDELSCITKESELHKFFSSDNTDCCKDTDNLNLAKDKEIKDSVIPSSHLDDLFGVK